MQKDGQLPKPSI